ncbi:MAG: SUMF1/EgtB/PvdO family nonheme iron enzyme, partial [Planctomycetota bacterium]
GTLTVVTEPPGAQVLVDGAYAGISPVDAQVPPDQDVVIRVARPGYDPARTTARVGPGDATTIELALTAQLGTVRLEVEPAGAILLVDGARLGTVPPEITLTAEEHRIELQREGYRPAVRTVTPRPGVMQTVEVRLEAIETPVARLAKQIKAGDGIPLVLVRPGTYTMGASRREQGRRSNETLRAVALTRPFYFGAREITNAEFKTFNADHDSGFVEATTLATASQPVAMVTWDDAARFCNWLSARDGLPAAYVEDGDSMRAVRPVTSGYRLPTEAEWEFVARSNGGNPMKYPWGGDYPPRGKAGNFADESASKLLGRVIESYEDGHVGSAPVASFAANGRGVHDLGGNVAEWCHDFYTIYSYDAEEVATDPAGPEQGEHHVIRGSSWRHSSISALRCSYRDYGAGRRDDLGFRICRYLTSEEASIENEAHQ